LGAVLDVASGRPTSVKELVDHLTSLVGAEAQLDQTDERRGDVPRTEGDIHTARTSLGWSPAVSLRDGLQRQVDWHRSIRADAPGARVIA
jgi:nucleoside-diphosphate-sugar epimerase